MAIRLITTVVGKAPRNQGNLTDVTFRTTGAASINGAQLFTLTLDNVIAASFSLNQVCNFYVGLSGAEHTSIEAAVTTTKGSTKD